MRQTDFFEQTKAEAWVETEESIDEAVNHADTEEPKWSESAYDYLQLYMTKHIGIFCADDVANWATEQGLSEPPTRYAWGGVFLKASRRNLIRKVGQKNHHYPRKKGTHTQTNNFWEKQ